MNGWVKRYFVRDKEILGLCSSIRKFDASVISHHNPVISHIARNVVVEPEWYPVLLVLVVLSLSLIPSFSFRLKLLFFPLIFFLFKMTWLCDRVIICLNLSPICWRIKRTYIGVGLVQREITLTLKRHILHRHAHFSDKLWLTSEKYKRGTSSLSFFAPALTVDS